MQFLKNEIMVKSKNNNNQNIVEVNQNSLDWTVGKIYQILQTLEVKVTNLESKNDIREEKNEIRFTTINHKIDSSDKKTKDEIDILKIQISNIKTNEALSKKDIGFIIGIAIAIGLNLLVLTFDLIKKFIFKI